LQCYVRQNKTRVHVSQLSQQYTVRGGWVHRGGLEPCVSDLAAWNGLANGEGIVMLVNKWGGAILLVAVVAGIWSCQKSESEPVAEAQQRVMPMDPHDPVLVDAEAMIAEGRETFRFDTFGDEVFWGGVLKLHEAIAGEANGGVGPGISPETALELGLKVDVRALPGNVRAMLRRGSVDLTDPATTLLLLQLDAVVGLKGFFNESGVLASVGIQCALCHSTVDDPSGIGNRLDGWPNRDLNVGAIILAAPGRQFFSNLLGITDDQLIEALSAWGPGKFDAELVLDGKAFQPDGRSAATLIPAAFGLAGVNLHTYTGWGGVAHWNAFVANIEMGGIGTFFDPRLDERVDECLPDSPFKFPIAQRAGFSDIRPPTLAADRITPKLPALHFYQLALKAPKPPAGSFDAAAAARGKTLFEGRAGCARCHVPPIFTDPGWNMHTPEEINIDAFQANRSPDEHYRTTPLGGLFTRAEGGFYHDGRFATLRDVVDHYDFLGAGLTNAEKNDLVEYLKSL
jgi:hypothetical protein